MHNFYIFARRGKEVGGSIVGSPTRSAAIGDSQGPPAFEPNLAGEEAIQRYKGEALEYGSHLPSLQHSIVFSTTCYHIFLMRAHVPSILTTNLFLLLCVGCFSFLFSFFWMYFCGYVCLETRITWDDTRKRRRDQI